VTPADRVIRWTTALAGVGVAAVAAVPSYEHAYALVRAHCEAGWMGRMVPLTVDGLIHAGSMVMLDSARRGTRVPVLARWLLGLGIAATLAAKVAPGLGHAPVRGRRQGYAPFVSALGPENLIHHGTSSRSRPKTDCGRSQGSVPYSSNWRRVTCPECKRLDPGLRVALSSTPQVLDLGGSAAEGGRSAAGDSGLKGAEAVGAWRQ
jgi:hypothetical protein